MSPLSSAALEGVVLVRSGVRAIGFASLVEVMTSVGAVGKYGMQGRRHVDSWKLLNAIFTTTQTQLQPYLYRDNRLPQRESIFVNGFKELHEALVQLRAILDIQSLAGSCHRLGQLAPLLRPHQPELWLRPRVASILELLFAELENRVEKADARQLMQVLWGVSRFGSSVLNPDSEALMHRIRAWLLEANEFGGNHACLMIEAMSNLEFPFSQSTLDFVLRDALYDFPAAATSPYNLLYFLKAVARRAYSVKRAVLEAAVGKCVFQFDELNMHHIALLTASMAELDMPPNQELLHLMRQRMGFGTWGAQEMWNDDLVSLSQSLAQLKVEALEVHPILAKLDILARERVAPLSQDQIQHFTQASLSMGYSADTPIIPFNHHLSSQDVKD